MKWTNNIIINTTIENVWTVLTTEEYSSQTMPNVVESKLIEDKGDVKIYQDTYKEGNRAETYLLTLTTLSNTNTHKKQQFEFTIANMIATKGTYELEAIDENTTSFTYSGENKGANFIGKIMMTLAKLFASDKESREYTERVKACAEKL